MSRTGDGFSDARVAPVTLPRTRIVPDPLPASGLPEADILTAPPLFPIDELPQADDRTALTCLIRLAMPRHESPETLADTLLTRFGSFAATLTTTDQALRSVAGIGPHLLSAIRVMQEAALRLHRAALRDREVLSDRPRLYEYLSAVLAREVIEQFRILFLSPDDHLIADEAQARGTVNHTPVYPREVVRRALELGAASLILVHNHPSGDPTPSPDDIAMTRQVGAAAAVLGLTIRDHIIVGNGQWLSFAEKGLL
ncbi:JAB domain-containing protein [Acetobacter musti]|uniref:JAB domain-containing protein n=1 Tax=Acetobacter musti TaxID=864732 RepID=UPI001F54D957|nr:DNA repair protein RadC [Acetobacter musti]